MREMTPRRKSFNSSLTMRRSSKGRFLAGRITGRTDGSTVIIRVTTIIIVIVAYKAPGSRSQSDSLLCIRTHTKMR